MVLARMLEKNFWVVKVMLIAASAFLTARGINFGVGLAFAADAAALSTPPLQVSPAETKASTRAVSAAGILSHNPFDHANLVLTDGGPAGPADGEGEGDPTDPRLAPACDALRVFGIVASERARDSFAAIQDGAEPKASLRRPGDQVGGKTVVAVGWDRVWLSQGRALCQAQLFRQPVAIATVAPATAAQPMVVGPPLEPSIARGIQRLSATEFAIDRGTLDRIIEAQAELMRNVQLAPERAAEKVTGLRLGGIRGGSLLATIGFENGDRLQSINGFDLTNPERALEAFARLRTQDKLVVQITRRGKVTNLDYAIR